MILARIGRGCQIKVDLELLALISSCSDCPLHAMREHAAPARPGVEYEPGGIAVMIDSPGNADNESGKPLTPSGGKYENAGAAFDKLLAGAGLRREQLLLMALVRCMPPRNRLADYPEALYNCDKWTVAELDKYGPRVVVLMGSASVRAIYGAKAKVTEVRRTLRSTEKHKWGARVYVPTYSPGAVLRSQELRDTVTEDLRLAREIWEG